MLKCATNIQVPFPNSSPNPKISYLLNKLMELCTKSVVMIVIFVYYGQTDRALITRIKEHKRAVSHSDQYSKIAKHAEQYDH